MWGWCQTQPCLMCGRKWTRSRPWHTGTHSLVLPTWTGSWTRDRYLDSVGLAFNSLMSQLVEADCFRPTSLGSAWTYQPQPDRKTIQSHATIPTLLHALFKESANLWFLSLTQTSEYNFCLLKWIVGGIFFYCWEEAYRWNEVIYILVCESLEDLWKGTCL